MIERCCRQRPEIAPRSKHMPDRPQLSAITSTRRRLIAVLGIAAVALVFRTVVAVVINYADYFPPNFSSGFLAGREAHFFGLYRSAFYAHVIVAPVTLLLGTLLVWPTFRQSVPHWHRRLGRVQCVCVVAFVGPSGLVMAFWPAAGPVAGVGLGLLAVATTGCCVTGWRAALRRSFDSHRRWMSRTFVLLCSAVVIRVLGGAGTVLEVTSPSFDVTITWISWVLPLGLYELVERSRRPPTTGNAPITLQTAHRSIRSRDATGFRVLPLRPDRQ